MVEVEQVPLRERLVEAIVVSERRDSRGVAGGLLAEVRRDRVRRHELRQEEHDGGDPDHQQHERGEAAQHEAREAVRAAEAP